MMRYFDFINFFRDSFEWIISDEEKRNYLNHVPRYCRQCELLGICRNKNNRWKCYHGCMVLHSERKRDNGE